MKNILKKITLVLIAIIAFSCTKDNSETNSETTNTQTGVFRYATDMPLNQSTNIKILPKAEFTAKFNTLIASDASGATIFEINLTAATVGAYPINASNVLTYTATNPFYVAASGTVNITASGNGKISGNFSVTDGKISRIYGDFTDAVLK